MTTAMHTMDLTTRLKALGACPEAVTWAETQESAEAAWANCARGHWMLWIVARVGVDPNVVRLAACQCARRALQYVPEGEDRPRLAIEAAEAHARGEITQAQLDAARAAAYAASAASAAAESAARAASAAAWAAANAAARAAESDAQAEIIRAAIPWAMVREAWTG